MNFQSVELSRPSAVRYHNICCVFFIPSCCYVFFLSHILHFISLVMLGEESTLWRSPMCNFLPLSNRWGGSVKCRWNNKMCSVTLSIYEHIYFHVIHNVNKTHNIKCYNLMVLGYMFRPHCGHLQANLYWLSALNMRTICDPIVRTIVTYVSIDCGYQ